MSGRKVIQICALPHKDEREECLFALCDDGSMLQRFAFPDAEWEQVPPVPSKPAA